MSNAVALLFTAFFSASALILSVIACAGSTKNYYPLNHIYTSQVDLTGVSISKVISSSTVLEINFPGYINIGLWSYCIETANKSVTSCTSPKGIQTFNLKELLYDNINDNSVLSTLDSASILLPQKIQDKMTYFNALIKCMFITILIGIVLSFLSTVVCIIRWCIHVKFVQVIGCLLSFLAFLSLLISAGCCVSALVIISRILDDNIDTYGIKFNFGHVYLGLVWGGVVAALLTFVTWCSVKSVRRPQVMYMSESIERKPLIH
ncbi:protein Pun1p [Monosporozyma servazzii]